MFQPVAQRLPVEPRWGVRAVNVGFRLLSGAIAPHARPLEARVEIVFVGIRLCDRLKHTAWPPTCPAVVGIANGAESS
jgi:hypothetical protein